MSIIKFSREKTRILKGIALILMIIHHTSIPELWAVEGTGVYNYFQNQVYVTKLCVWIFAFLVGYGFFYSANKTLKYSLKRILLLIIPFWTMMFLMFIPFSFYTGGINNAMEYKEITSPVGTEMILLEIVYNLFGISESLNWYSWFVCFYILEIISMPFLHRLFVRFPKYGWMVAIVCFYVFAALIHTFLPWDSNLILLNIFIFSNLIALVIVGYMCAFWNYKGLLPKWFEGKNKWWLSLLVILLVLIIQGLQLPTKGFCIQAFYTPFFIFAIVGLFNSHSLNGISRFLQKVGDLSMYMWFFHAVFFTETVNLYTKNLVMEPFHSFPYTLLMTFVLTYLGSWCFKKLLTPIMNKIK